MQSLNIICANLVPWQAREQSRVQKGRGSPPIMMWISSSLREGQSPVLGGNCVPCLA
jgi:hypothetical protein